MKSVIQVSHFTIKDVISLTLKKLSFVFLILVFLLLFDLDGCIGKPSAQNQLVDGLVNKVVSVLDDIRTYQLDMDLTNGFSYVAQDNNQLSVEQWEWKSQRIIDLKTRQLKMDMDSGDGVSQNTWEAYIVDGWEYLKTISPPAYGPGAPWTKTNQSSQVDSLLSNENQLPSQIELLRTAKEFYVVGDDNVDGVDCFVLNVIPTNEAISEWVLAQQQPAGPSFILYTGADYDNSYKNGWVRLFIDKATWLIVRTDIDALFAGKINMSFSASMNFSNINKPVSLVVPQEAYGTP